MIEISFYSHPNSSKVMATKFVTWHDSCAVLACAKFFCHLVTSDWITARRNFHQIWIVSKLLLVKQAPNNRQQQYYMHISWDVLQFHYQHSGIYIPSRLAHHILMQYSSIASTCSNPVTYGTEITPIPDARHIVHMHCPGQYVHMLNPTPVGCA